MRVYTEEQMRNAEKSAFSAGISFLRLMENAGSACAERILQRIRDDVNVLILCGKGKNGGDGFVVARKLAEKGVDTTAVLLFGEPTDSDSHHMFEQLLKTNAKIKTAERVKEYISDADVIVDAVFGIGFKGTAKGFLPDVFDSVNKSKATVFSIDVPSGLVCDSGEVGGVCIRADFTVAISGKKLCHVLKPASTVCGKILTAFIGVERDYYKDSPYFGYTFTADEIKKMFRHRKEVSNKGDYGRVLCICGSVNYAGAAVLAVGGALRSGAGLVFASFPDAAYPAIASKLTESPLLPMPSDSRGCFSNVAIPLLLSEIEKADAVVLGCGLGKSLGTAELTYEIIRNCKCPLIIDADGINLVCENIDILREAKCKIYMTPHPGEMSRLIGKSIDEILENPAEIAKKFANEYSVTLILKGANTVVAHPGGEAVYINENGNNGLSKGGSGDLLSGILGGFVAQRGHLPAETAVFIHGMCADRTASRLSRRGMLPSDCLFDLPLILSEFEEE